MAVQQHIRAINRQGMRCDTMKSRQAVTKRKRKIVDDKGSFEKLVGGVSLLKTRS